MWDCVAMLVREKDPIGPSNVRASAVTAPSTAANSDLARPRNVAFGSWTAIRRNARMLQHCLSKQTPLPAPRAVGKLGIVMMTDIRGASITKAKERRWRGAYLFQRRMRRCLHFAIRATRSSFLRTVESGLTSAPMKFAASAQAFHHALSAEIAASEQIRMRVLAATLAILLLGDQLFFLFARETLEQFAGRVLPTWLPLRVFGPFLAYEIVALVVLRYRRARGKSIPTALDLASGLCASSVHRSRCGNQLSGNGVLGPVVRRRRG